jgi:hypothetical protein
MLDTSPASGSYHYMSLYFSFAAMAPKTSSADTPPLSLVDSLDPSYEQSPLDPTLDTLAFVL